MQVFHQHKIALLILLCVIVLGILSCRKFVDLAPPLHQVQTHEIFQNDQSALSAVAGLYGKLSGSLLIGSGAESIYTGLSSDELYNPVSSATYDPFYQNALMAANGQVLSFWSGSYNIIYQANSILKGVENASLLSANLRSQLIGEILFIRAYQYFYLVSLFGDVPLVLDTDYRKNGRLPRAEVKIIYAQIEDDLKAAVAQLQPAYPSAFKGRPNRLAAMALLARVYLHQQKYSDAETTSTAVINSGLYALAPVNNVFLSGSGETIWQLIRDNNNTAIASVLLPSSAMVRPALALTNFLVASFEPGDQRRVSWTGTNSVSGQNFVYAAKYKVRLSSPISEYYVVLRLAEQYLIRAEAFLRQSQTSNSIADLNVLRKRAGLPILPLNLTAQATTLALEQEKRIEFFVEGGHRWFDLKRWGKADAVFGILKPGSWQPYSALYPIPQPEIDKAPWLSQNPGY